jgi:putative copper resistance protein D
MSWLAWVRTVHLAASALVGGAVAFELLVLRRAAVSAQAPKQVRQVRRWLATMGAVGIAIGLLSWAAWLAEVTIGMTGLPPTEALAASNLHIVVAQTTFGQVCALRCGLFVLLALGLVVASRASEQPALWQDLALAGLAAALLGSLAWTGHAVASVRAHRWVDAAHLCAAALWVGMLPPLWLVLQRACTTGEAEWLRLAARAARLFSPPAIAAVLVLVLTGALNSWWLVGTPGKLLGSSYGLLLTGKLVLFAAMLALAASNRIVLTPRMEQPAPATTLRAARHLQRNVVAEMLLAAAVLAVVGTLGVTPPAAHEHPADHHHHHHDAEAM